MPAAEEVRENKRRYRIDPFIWVIPLILSGIGILMITSTTSPNSFTHTGTPFQMGIKQAQWLLIALSGMFVVFSVPLRFWKMMSGPILILTWFMSWLPLIPGVGVSVGGASRWINVPGSSISIQPGELLCLAMALHLAKLLSKRDKDPGKAFLSTIILVWIAALPLALQPDLGTIILIFMVSMGMYVERIGWKWPVMAGGLLGGIVFLLLIFFEPYRMRRVTAFMDPWSDPLDTGFQAIQGLIAFANGGFWGTGLGHGFQKLNYLTAAYTDFIYAAIGEELGLMGTLGVIGLFAFWVSQARMVYYRVPDGFKSSLTWGVTLTVILPLVINVAGVTKLIPLTGMPLPFVSYGGTSLLTMWSRVGIMLRLDKESRDREERP